MFMSRHTLTALTIPHLSKRLHGDRPPMEIYSGQLCDSLNGHVFRFEFLGCAYGIEAMMALHRHICAHVPIRCSHFVYHTHPQAI